MKTCRDFLRLAGTGIGGTMLFPSLGKSVTAAIQGSEKTHPNILFILVDGLGIESNNPEDERSRAGRGPKVVWGMSGKI